MNEGRYFWVHISKSLSKSDEVEIFPIYEFIQPNFNFSYSLKYIESSQ